MKLVILYNNKKKNMGDNNNQKIFTFLNIALSITVLVILVPFIDSTSAAEVIKNEKIKYLFNFSKKNIHEKIDIYQKKRLNINIFEKFFQIPTFLINQEGVEKLIQKNNTTIDLIIKEVMGKNKRDILLLDPGNSKIKLPFYSSFKHQNSLNTLPIGPASISLIFSKVCNPIIEKFTKIREKKKRKQERKVWYDQVFTEPVILKLINILKLIYKLDSKNVIKGIQDATKEIKYKPKDLKSKVSNQCKINVIAYEEEYQEIEDKVRRSKRGKLSESMIRRLAMLIFLCIFCFIIWRYLFGLDTPKEVLDEMIRRIAELLNARKNLKSCMNTLRTGTNLAGSLLKSVEELQLEVEESRDAFKNLISHIVDLCHNLLETKGLTEEAGSIIRDELYMIKEMIKAIVEKNDILEENMERSEKYG